MSIRSIMAMFKYGKQVGKQAANGQRCFVSTSRNGEKVYTTLDKDFQLIRTKTFEGNNYRKTATVRDSKGKVTDIYDIERTENWGETVHKKIQYDKWHGRESSTESLTTSSYCIDYKNKKINSRVTADGKVTITSLAEDGSRNVEKLSVEDYLSKYCTDDTFYSLRGDGKYLRHGFTRQQYFDKQA